VPANSFAKPDSLDAAGGTFGRMTNGLPLAATGAILAAGRRATHRIEDLPGVTGSKTTTP